MLSIKNLTKIYKIKGGNDTVALDKVNIEFPEKGMVFLLGKSGSGKSTLLNLIGGLDFPTDGEIILKGRSSKDFSQSDFDSYRNTYIGFIFQEYNILNEFNVEQNIALAIELQGKKVTKEAVDNLLDQVDLNGFAKRKPNTLSGGQKQRIAIARALIKEPNIIMADEPTGALDSKTGEQVFETLKKLSADKLVIVVSHDRDFAERFGDRIIELKDGKILTDQTKHMVESTPISDNVTIINDHAIKINDAKKLTKKDFDQLYESIKNSDGKVFISSGENADKSMKVARISEDGRSDEFKETGDIEVKQYDPSQTTFIRSKMPVSKSTKMGLSSLKTKPVRLGFTMLLSVISFTMFGVASALMLYNSSHTYSEALRKTDYTAEVLQKSSTGKQVSQTFDADGKLIEEWSYTSFQPQQFGVNEVKDLNKNSHGLVYIPICDINSPVSFQKYTLEKDASFYNQHYRITHLSDASREEFDKLGYKLDGQYPTNNNEVLIPKVYAQMLIDSEAIKKPNYTDIIGETVSIYTKQAGKDKYTICGLYDAGDVPQRYFDLTNSDAKLTPEEKSKLSSDLDAFFANSFNSVAFVSAETFDNCKNEFSTNDHYVQTVSRAGLYIDIAEIGEGLNVGDDYFDSFYTDEIINKNRDQFVIYDLDDNIVTDFSMKEDEVYFPIDRFNQFAFSARESFFDYFIRLNIDESIMKYMPTYRAFLANEDNYETVANYRMDMYRYSEQIKELLTQYINEFNRAYKIDKFIGMFISSDTFSTIPEDKQNLLNTVNNASTNDVTEANIAEVYSVLDTYADSADTIKYYLPSEYIKQAMNNDSYNYKIYNDSNLYSIAMKNSATWTSEEAQKAIDFLNENCQKGFGVYYQTWDTLLKGYTFKDYVPANDRVLKADPNAVCYYKTSTGKEGTLKIAGYYKCEFGSWALLLNKSFIEANSSTSGRGNDRTYASHFETEYVEPADARYSNVMVKTKYTQEQVEFMFKCNIKGAKYDFTSERYRTVSFIVEMISILKNVFLWTGVGFGVFSALMMLNFITISIANKKKDIGILRAIGARKSDVFKIFFSESLFISTVCTLLSLIFSFIAEFFLDRYFVKEIGISILQFNIISVGLVVLVSLVIAVIATIIPVLHSSKKPPVESIRAL